MDLNLLNMSIVGNQFCRNLQALAQPNRVAKMVAVSEVVVFICVFAHIPIMETTASTCTVSTVNMVSIFHIFHTSLPGSSDVSAVFACIPVVLLLYITAQ